MTITRESAPGAAATFSPLAKLALVGIFAWVGASSQPAHAYPDGTVVNGDVTFQQVGNTLIITASNGSIITYPAFNIGAGETVQFIQPGQWATVLNHVLGPDPSVIAGNLLANGQVYIVNPAGVYFNNGAVVNVGGLYAAAGHISYDNFAAGMNHFTDLSGSVVNNGRIVGGNINLFGEYVANHGIISAPQGTVVMAAGNDVYVYEQGGRVSLRVDGTTLTDQALPQSGSTTPNMASNQPGVENTGTVVSNQGSIILGAGDLYSLAIRNSGVIRANGGEVQVVAADGLIHNTATGVINTSVNNGDAGDITIQGPSIVNSGRIAANSNNGEAGSIEVTSQNHTFLTDTSRISAAGGLGDADGGNVLIHSYNGLTVMSSGARVDVSGGATGGSGGFAEVSGEYLTFNGRVNLRSVEPGERGTLFLDPINLTITEFGGDDAFLNDSIIDFGEGGALVSISASALEALVGAILLQASGNISVFHEINFDPANNNSLTLEAGENIFINAPITGVHDLTLTANYLNETLGSVHVNAPINALGNVTMSGFNIFMFLNPTGGDTSVTSGGYQHYLSSVDICEDTVLAAGDDIHFYSTLNSSVANEHGLTLNVSGEESAAIFDDAVGQPRRLEYLVVNGASEINGGVIRTYDHQHYNGAVTLGDDASLFSSNAGQILFGSTVNGPHELFASTAGLTQFDGVVGGQTELLGVFTDAPGTTQIGANQTAGALWYGDPVVLANTVTLTGHDVVNFDQTVTGGGHSLFVNSPLTYFHGNATGFDRLETDADGTTYFGGSQEGEDGPVLVSGNELDFNDDAVVLWDATFTGLDFVDFGKTLNGTFDVVTNSDHFVRFGGDVGDVDPLASLTTNVAPPDVLDQNLVLIDGNLIRVVGDINFNPDGRLSPAQVATIAARNFGGLTIESLNGNIFMGLNEKLTSMGNLSLIAQNGTMTLGDLNAYGDVLVDCPTVFLYAREGGQILDFNGNLIDDPQASFVAWGEFIQVNPGMTVTLLGDGLTPIFASGITNSFPGPLGDFLSALFAGLAEINFTYNGTILDLTPPDLAFDYINQLIGPNRIEDRIYLDPVISLPTNSLAINSRSMSDAEKRDTTTGRYLPSDAWTKPTSGSPSDYQVVINRLRRNAINDSLAKQDALAFEQEIDPETGEVIARRERQPQVVKAALAKAWAAYLTREPAVGSAEGFAQFLKEEPGQEEALAYYTNLRQMVVNLTVSGLSPKEVTMSLDHVVKDFVLEGMTQQEFMSMLGVQNVG